MGTDSIIIFTFSLLRSDLLIELAWRLTLSSSFSSNAFTETPYLSSRMPSSYNFPTITFLKLSITSSFLS